MLSLRLLESSENWKEVMNKSPVYSLTVWILTCAYSTHTVMYSDLGGLHSWPRNLKLSSSVLIFKSTKRLFRPNNHLRCIWIDPKRERAFQPLPVYFNTDPFSQVFHVFSYDLVLGYDTHMLHTEDWVHCHHRNAQYCGLRADICVWKRTALLIGSSQLALVKS